MPILDRYIGTEAARGYLLTAVVLLGLFAFIDLAVQFEDVGEGAYGTADAVLFTLYQLPRRLVDLTPFAALLAAVMALGGMTANSELVILRSAGIPPLRIVAGLLKAGAILLVLLTAVELFVAPTLQQQALQMRNAALAGNASSDSLWARSADGIIHVGGLRHGHIPTDIEIYRFGPDRQLEVYIHAASADIGSDNRWRLHDVLRKQLQPGPATSEHLNALPWRPAVTAEQLGILSRPPASLSIMDLYHYIVYLRAQDQNALPFNMALWHKLTLPLLSLAMILLAAPLAFANPRSTGIGTRLATGAAIGLAVYAGDQFATSMGLILHLHPALVTLLPAVAISAAGLLWLHRLR